MGAISVPTFLILVPIAHLLLLAIPLAVYDIRERRLPNKWVVPNLALAFVSVVATMFFGEWGRALIALGVALLVFVLLLVANNLDVVGMGDVKLLTAVSLPFAWFSPLYVLALIGLVIVATAIVVLYKIYLSRSPKPTLPLGPIVLATFAGLAGTIVFSL